MRMVVLEARQAHTPQPITGRGVRLPLGDASKLRSHGHVAEHGLPGQQRVGLEHEAHPAGDTVDLPATDRDDAGARADQARR